MWVLSMKNETDQILEIITFVSTERLGTFRNLTDSDANAIKLHQHTMQLGAALMSVLGAIEIATRNRVCRQLDLTFGTDDWLFNPPLHFKWKDREKNNIKDARRSAQRVEYSKLDNASKKALDDKAFPGGVPSQLNHFKTVGKRQEQLTVRNGQVVAQLTMYFWKRLFSEEYERALWKRSLKQVFPNKKLTRAQIAQNLEILYQARNRIAHHEPIYGTRLVAILESIEFMTQNFAVRNPSADTPLAKFLAPHRTQLDKQVENFLKAWDSLTK